MNAPDPNTGGLPSTLRALAMGLVVETVVPMGKSPPMTPMLTGHGSCGTDARAASWRDIRWKCDELMALVFQTDDPKQAAAYVLGYLPKHIDYVFELLCGRKQERVS
jgi:hypothetical protein